MFLQILEKGPSTKICHKCAFEIDQCDIFVGKVKNSSKSFDANQQWCGLCSNAYNQDILFNLSKQKTEVDDLVQQIKDLFSSDDEVDFIYIL